jgi:uncharacterized protein (TIGR00106 family)
MHVIADVAVIPVGEGASLASHVATCEDIIKDAGLNYRLHAHGTNVEGSWEEVTTVVKRCHEALHEQGVAQINTSLKIATYIGDDHGMEDRVRKVQELQRK